MYPTLTLYPEKSTLTNCDYIVSTVIYSRRPPVYHEKESESTPSNCDEEPEYLQALADEHIDNAVSTCTVNDEIPSQDRSAASVDWHLPHLLGFSAMYSHHPSTSSTELGLSLPGAEITGEGEGVAGDGDMDEDRGEEEGEEEEEDEENEGEGRAAAKL